MIYLDYSADTPPDPQVVQAYAEAAAAAYGNPNSHHSAGLAAKEIVDVSIREIAELLGISPGEIIMTGSASEANNLAIKGLAHASRRRGRHIVSTFLEHSSVSGALTFLQEQGWEIDLVQLLPDGTVDLSHLRSLLREDTVLCAVCAVDSELGTVQPIGEIASVLQDYPNCRLHVDAVQAVGKIPVDISCADTASIAPHKFYGLKGSGILYKREGVVLEPMIHGGASTTIYRSGTPDTAGIRAAAAALRLAQDALAERLAQVQRLQQMLKTACTDIPHIVLNSPSNAIPHILNFSSEGVKGEEMQRRMDENGICISVKSACSVPNTPSRPVYAITRDRKRALSSWRVSLSHLTTEAALDAFQETLRRIMMQGG